MENQNKKSRMLINTIMGILAYLGPFIIVSYLVAKDEAFVKFHIKQGLVLIVLELIIWILSMILWPLAAIFWIFNLATLVLTIIGIINVLQNQEKKLPLVGDWAKYFTF